MRLQVWVVYFWKQRFVDIKIADTSVATLVLYYVWPYLILEP